MVAASAGAQATETEKRMAAIKTVGVIGSGQMGNGIAHVAALAGFNGSPPSRVLTALPPAIS